MTIPTMQQAMGADLGQLFRRDMPTECVIGARKFSVLLDDLLAEEIEGYGGPENVDLQRVHFLTTDKPSIENGTQLFVGGKSKIVVSSVRSADGNELIATVRGD